MVETDGGPIEASRGRGVGLGGANVEPATTDPAPGEAGGLRSLLDEVGRDEAAAAGGGHLDDGQIAAPAERAQDARAGVRPVGGAGDHVALLWRSPGAGVALSWHGT